MRILRLAEKLGAETVTLNATEMSSAIVKFSNERNVTKIVIGKPTRRGWKRFLLGSVVDVLISDAHNINLYLLGSPRPDGGDGNRDHAETSLYRKNPLPGLSGKLPSRKKDMLGYVWALVVTVASTVLAHLMFGRFELANLIMVFLLGVVFIATRFGRGPSIFASVLGVAIIDLFFVTPYFSFSVSDSQYLVTLLAMLTVAMLISNLMANVRSQAKVAGHRERRATVLYAMSRDLTASQNEDEIVYAAVHHLYSEFGSRNVILFPDTNGRIIYPTGQAITESLHAADLSVAQWVMDHNEIAGQGTDTLPGAEAVYFPLSNKETVLGVLVLLPVNLRRVFLPEQQKLLETFIAQIAQAITRVRLTEQARKAQVEMEAERLRNSLLSSISHDLRTPLATIVGSASALVEEDHTLKAENKRELSRAIYDEAQRMSTLVNNILDMARLDAGAVELNKQWVPLEEMIGAVLTLLQKRLTGRLVTVKLPPGIPMIYVDAVMIEQVLINLLENVLRYTPEGSPVEIRAEASPSVVEISVADRGPGIPEGSENKLFEKFYRVQREAAQSGVGLGLTICRAIIEAHGGRIQAQNRPTGGAVFSFMIPLDHAPPVMGGRMNIVVIEDDPAIRLFLRTGLGAHGFKVFEADRGKQGIVEAGIRKPDLIILDLGLPDMDGVDVIKTIREWSAMPIIILSARSTEQHKIEALDAGADDYLTKPFGLGELLARLRVALRHSVSSPEQDQLGVFTSGALKVDLLKRQVDVGDREVHLTPIQYRLLSVLIKNAGKVLTHQYLLKEVWGPSYKDNSHYLRIYMSQLRQKLETDPAQPQYLLTESGVGYRLKV